MDKDIQSHVNAHLNNFVNELTFDYDNLCFVLGFSMQKFIMMIR